jgi:hypothetical protein
MRAWEELTNQERLGWNVAGETRREHGINYFKSLNLRRLRRGEELARVPPPYKPYDGEPVLKRLIIRNRGGLISLWVELRRVPIAPRSVWGSLPCNLGLARPDKCPRLGLLSEPKNSLCEITGLYFNKHGKHIMAHLLPMLGKRIFIRLKLEVDDAPNTYEEAKAVVPPAQTRAKRQKPHIPFEAPSRPLRSSFEAPS